MAQRKGLKRACSQICNPHIRALTATHLAVGRTMTIEGFFPYLYPLYYILSFFFSDN